MTEPEPEPVRCGSCGVALPGTAPAPAGQIALCGDRCAPLRLHGDRFARGMEHQPFADFARVWNREQSAR